MNFGFGKSHHEVIYFVGSNKVVKEMEFGEFEAVLDGVVSEVDFAGDEYQAVFARLDTKLNILSAVFFLIEFDDDGALKLGWNLPLEQLAETAAYGPQLNGTTVRLACRSQCPIPWLSNELWEPDLSAQSNTLKMLAAQAKQNRLGLFVEKSASAPPVVTMPNHSISSDLASGGSIPSNDAQVFDDQKGAAADPLADISLQEATGADYQRVVEALTDREEMLRANLRQKRKEERDQALLQQRENMAQGIKKLRAQLVSMKQKYELEIESIEKENSRSAQLLKTKIEKLSGQLVGVEKKSVVLKNENNVLHEQLQVQKERHEQNIKEMAENNGFDHETLRRHMRRELQAKLIEHTSEIESQLELKEVEANYREEQIKRLQRDIATLKSDSGTAPAGDFLLEAQRFEADGMHFLVSLPVLGPIRIPASELSAYRLDAEAYLASRSGVQRDVFSAWWTLARNPVCGHLHADGRKCGIPINPGKPQLFEIGFSDRCDDHEGEEISQPKRAS